MKRKVSTIRLLAAILVLTACGLPPESQPPADRDTVAGSSAAVEPESGDVFECPVTIPSQPGLITSPPDGVTYSENFPAPEPWPAEYPHEGMVWYGTENLWTALAVNGDHGGRKSVWWSANFPGGIDEEQPVVSVTWTRLDTDDGTQVDNGGLATNAYISDEGWFMIAGIDPSELGCWEVTATYKGASLSYVCNRS